MSADKDSCLLSCKPCEGCGQHIPKTRTYCEKCAPDATAGDGLRTRAEAICMDMPGIDYDDGGVSWHRQIDYIETALRDVLAAAARYAEKVRRVEAVVEKWDSGELVPQLAMVHIRRALDGTP